MPQRAETRTLGYFLQTVYYITVLLDSNRNYHFTWSLKTSWSLEFAQLLLYLLSGCFMAIPAHAVEELSSCVSSPVRPQASGLDWSPRPCAPFSPGAVVH